MAISSYLKRCGYQQNELENVLYLIPKTATKKVHIDGDEAYVEYSGDTSSIIKIKGNNLAFQEDTSFDDRFRFDKTITLTVDGYITFKDFYSKYYAIVEDKSGTFWMVNADFPSYITYTYTLNDGENKTDLVFYAESNIPTIKLANFNPDNVEECETYMPYGIENLKLLEKNKSKLSTHDKYIITYSDFYTIEALDGTYELVEEFNGETYTTQLSFSIPLSDYKASWHVKLLEFEKNKYCGYLTLKNSDYKAILGYNTGLFPSYVINGDIVTITLTEISNYGMVFDDDYDITAQTLYRWVSTNTKICTEVTNTLWREHGTTCAGEHGVDKYKASILKVSYDSGMTYYNTDIISATTLIQPNSPDCGYAERWIPSGTTCVGYDKYVNAYKQVSYDYGSTWATSQPIIYSATTLIEHHSFDCGWIDPNECLTIEALENVSIKYHMFYGTFESETEQEEPYLLYSINGGDWTFWSSPNNRAINARVGDKVHFHSNLNYPALESIDLPGWFITTGKFKAYGRIKSLFLKNNTLIGNMYGSLFKGTEIVDASGLIFEYAESVPSYCYNQMFNGCTNLVSVPSVLSAPSLGERCYASMFQGCTSLTTAPIISATTDVLSARTVSSGACEYMFSGCTSLRTAPSVLPYTIIDTLGYRSMFEECTSLTTAPVLSATTFIPYIEGGGFGGGQCANMFKGCTSLTSVPQNMLPATAVTNDCYISMFSGCTSLTNTPNLPATSLDDMCYMAMFADCTSLTAATSILPALATYGGSNYAGMFSGCTSLTTAPVICATTINDYGSYTCFRMFYGCTSLTTVHTLPATSLSFGCYYEMFTDCTSLASVPQNMLPATALTRNTCAGCYELMFAGCTSLTIAPKLLSTTDDPEAFYSHMFTDCTSLNSVTCLADNGDDWPLKVYRWLVGVATYGTFYKNPNAEWERGPSGIPNNWTIVDYSI